MLKLITDITILALVIFAIVAVCLVIRLCLADMKGTLKKYQPEHSEQTENISVEPKSSMFPKGKAINSGEHISAFEQDGIRYSPFFDKEKGLYVPMVVTDINNFTDKELGKIGLTQKNIIYYQLISIDILHEIHNHFTYFFTKENNNG